MVNDSESVVPVETKFFDDIPKDSAIQCQPPLEPAVLLLPSNDTGNKNVIEIGASSRVIPNRNALVVGRQVSSCDIRISHKSLSRQHALLYYHASKLFVLDMKTKAGTFVNQEKILSSKPVELKNGDTVQFGKAKPALLVSWNGIKKKNIDNGDDGDKNSDIVGTTKDDGGEIEKESGKGSINPQCSDESSLSGLAGRDRRKAEIAAMMASLEETPTYKKYTPNTSNTTRTQHSNPTSSACVLDKSPVKQKKKRVLEKHQIPLTECTDFASMETSHISAAMMDPTGARFAIGSLDSTLKLYDFAGYNVTDPVPFQNLIVEDGYPIRNIAYSSDGASILIGTGSTQPRVFNRDGQELLQFVRGDVYVRDPSKTIGHTAAVTGVAWHPLEKSIVFSTSRDGSLRSWNVDNGKLSFGMLNCLDVVVIKDLKTGRKTIPLCLAVSPNALAVGTECGSLQIFKYPLVSKLRPQQSVQVSTSCQIGGKANEEFDRIVSLSYSVDATKIAVRTKSEVTIWNTASKISSSTPPWIKFDDLPIHDEGVEVDSSMPTMAFSPNGKLFCVATSARDNNSPRLRQNKIQLFLLPKEYKEAKSIAKYKSPIFTIDLFQDVTEIGSVLSLSWHHKLNQILVTTKKGFQIFFSTEWSKKGILLTSGRRKKRRNVEESLQDLYASRAPPPGSVIRQEDIITPNSLPLFSGDKQRFKSKKQRSEEEHLDSVAKHIPQQPSKGVFNTGVNMFTQMIMDDRSSNQKKIAGMDPREALAKYSEGKTYIGKAYEGNVERILANKTVEQEEEEMAGNSRRRKN